MKDLRIEVKIKNNILYSAIMEKGYKTVGEFSQKNNIYATNVGSLLNFKRSPLYEVKKGRGYRRKAVFLEGSGETLAWSKEALNLSIILSIPVEDLFPEQLREARQNLYIIEMESWKLLYNKPKSLDDIVIGNELKEKINKVLKTLHPRTQKFLNMNFGLNGEEEHNMKEIAEHFDISNERVRQILHKGFRYLKHPSRSKYLRDFVEN